MSIPLRCPNCDSSFVVNDEFAGTRAVCPSCKSPVPVPGLSADDESTAAASTATRGPWLVAGAAGILAAAALLFAVLSYSRARSLADSLATAEQRANVAATSADEMRARLADVERRTQEADAGRDDVHARLVVAERKADAAVAAREDLKKQFNAAPPVAATDVKDRTARRTGSVTLPNSTRRTFTTLSGGRFVAGVGRADSIQRAPGEIVLYPAGERLKEVAVPVESIQSLAIGPRVEKDPDADDAERLFSVQVTGTDGKQNSWTVEAPLTVYVHWSDGHVVEQFLNRDLLGLTFTFENDVAKGK
jgi:hypothetical protein